MSPTDVIPISALEHHVYCPRQAALILVEDQWLDSAYTTRGTLGHRRADQPGGRFERNRQVVRAVPLWSERYGLVGRADAVEVSENGDVTPVEYKIGGRHGDAAQVQLCAEGLCLEEMLDTSVFMGALWLAGPRRRLAIAFDAELRKRTLEVLAAVRKEVAEPMLPPAVADERCPPCQLRPRCLPDLVAAPADFARRVAEVLGS